MLDRPAHGRLDSRSLGSRMAVCVGLSLAGMTMLLQAAAADPAAASGVASVLAASRDPCTWRRELAASFYEQRGYAEGWMMGGRPGNRLAFEPYPTDRGTERCS